MQTFFLCFFLSLLLKAARRNGSFPQCRLQRAVVFMQQNQKQKWGIPVLFKLSAKPDSINLFFARGQYCPTSSSMGWRVMINGNIYSSQSMPSSIPFLSESVQCSETHQSLCKNRAECRCATTKEGGGREVRSWGVGKGDRSSPAFCFPVPQTG